MRSCCCRFFTKKKERKALLAELTQTHTQTIPTKKPAQSPHQEKYLEDSGSFSEQGDSNEDIKTIPHTLVEKNKFELNSADLTYLQEIGEGSFSTIAKGKLKHSISVAIKMPIGGNNNEKIKEERTLLEILNKNKNHPYAQYIITYHGFVVRYSSIHLVLGYCNGGLLSERIAAPNTPDWSQWGIKRAWEMAQGLAFLHAHNIIHYDFKNKNIMLHTENKIERAIIIDLNLSELVRPSMLKPFGKGSILYYSPEIMLNLVPTLKTDIFSFALAMLEIITGEDAYRNYNIDSAIKLHNHLIIKKKTDDIPDDLEDDLKELVKNCFMFEPQDRPDAETVVTTLKKHVAKNGI